MTDEIRSAFVVYLASGNKPMAETLSPRLASIDQSFVAEFQGMTRVPVAVADLEYARARLIDTIQSSLTLNERRFLLSLKRCEPEWDLLPFSGLEAFPAIQWKLRNLRRLAQDPARHLAAVDRLRAALQL